MKKHLLIVAALGSTLIGLAASSSAADVGVSISIGQPGFYGQIDIGNFGQPRLFNPQPVIIGQVVAGSPPVYLRVPPGHRKHWSRNCHKYNACGAPVYFVRDDWYQRVYVPRYQQQHSIRAERIENRVENRVERRMDRREDRREERREEKRGGNRGNNGNNGNNGNR